MHISCRSFDSSIVIGDKQYRFPCGKIVGAFDSSIVIGGKRVGALIQVLSLVIISGVNQYRFPCGKRVGALIQVLSLVINCFLNLVICRYGLPPHFSNKYLVIPPIHY